MSNEVTTGKRFPRERFTRALVRLCERLDANPVLTYDYQTSSKELWTLQVRGPIRARVVALYAFGSWARGAIDCGDLDLAAHLEYEWAGAVEYVHERTEGRMVRGGALHGCRPTFTEVHKSVLGPVAHVHVLDYLRQVDLAEKGESTLDPKKFLLIWRNPVDGQGSRLARSDRKRCPGP
jgi:hypothetical protein